jgi:integrase
MKKKEFRSSISDPIKGFLDFRQKRGFARTTYLPSLHALDEFYAQNCCGQHYLTRENVISWLATRENAGTAQFSHDCIAVRQLGEYLQSIGQDAYVLSDKFSPRYAKNTPHIFTDDELSALFRAIDTLPCKTHACYFFENEIVKVLFRLIYTCGLRPSEARELRREDINMESGEILIRYNKQHKERIIVMSDEMLSLYRSYSQKLDICMPQCEYAFPNKLGIPFATEHISRLFKQCWQNANPSIPKDELPRVRVYDLRHRFASAAINKWLDDDVDVYVKLPYLRAYMGHEDLNATAYYIHLLPENIVKSNGVDWAALSEPIPEVSV